MVSPHEVARDAAETGLMRFIKVLAVTLPLLALVQVAANSGDYNHPAAAMVVWLAVLGAGARLAPRLRTGGLASGEVAAAIMIAVAAVAAIGLVHKPHAPPGNVDLAILGTVSLLVLVVMSRSARVWVPAALFVFAVQSALLVRAGGLSPLSLSELGAAGYVIATVLISFAALRPTLTVHVAVAARQASLASRLAAERAAAAAIGQERRGRLAVLEKEALPLLRAIADGTLDPAREDVRQECARYAASLRNSLAGGTSPGDGLTAVLEPALRAAAARDLLVTVQVVGDPGTPRPAVASALLTTVDAVLSALAPDQVMLTVLASGDDVELYLTFGTPPRAAPDLTRCGLDVPAAARWRAHLDATETGGGYLEVNWRKEGVLDGRH